MSDVKTIRDDASGPGATEENMEKIREIHGSEALGYGGSGREEHSGQNAPVEQSAIDDLADNTPEQTK